jgi:hypothetical protein
MAQIEASGYLSSGGTREYAGFEARQPALVILADFVLNTVGARLETVQPLVEAGEAGSDLRTQIVDSLA